jgi:hypothetical protein
MKFIKTLFILSTLILVSDYVSAQQPNDDPKNPFGCAYQVQGTGGTHKRFHCISCGLSYGTCVQNMPPCPYCWEAIERAENPGIYDITIYLAGEPVHYVGTNINTATLYDAADGFLGFIIEFDEYN